MPLSTSEPLPPWPLSGHPRACSPQGRSDLAAVPLLPSDRELTWDQYLSRLASRLTWLSRYEPNSVQLTEQMFQDRNGSAAFLNLNPDEPIGPQLLSYETVLNLLSMEGVRSDRFPARVMPSLEAKEAIDTVTLQDWLVNLIPGHG